jgi:UDP-N-acetylglucosamine diphosphorylase / glucose-1-phosphate thymidylyltransferase / UDP-N-acetylgalactosamine diphosphorylase / glucosamine-1-phosphate N-acetyltransferase / galactosamine-1-phosphate N-acetyltransferase
VSKATPSVVVLVYEDDAISQLHPVTTARPGYAITCASFRLIDWLTKLDLKIYGQVRPHLQTVQLLDFGLSEPAGTFAAGSHVLLVNARSVPTPSAYSVFQQLVKEARPQAIRDEKGTVCAAYVVPQSASTAAELIALASQEAVPASACSLALFNWPHEVVSCHMKAMNDAMQYRIAHGNYQQLQDGVFVRASSKIGQYPVIDTSKGPILLEEDVQVGPFCYLSGPVYAGRKTRVIEHSALKDAVSLGHTTKIGGEVEASVIEPYTNKQHHGFLGHSYLGSWINLGAGTCNSDLKNTYGNINMEYGNEKVATEMQFMGCVMGDYSKTAINTGIFTGKIVGVCSMLYGFVTTNVPSFVTYARLFGQTSMLPAEVMISTQARMFARRKVEQRECDRQLILDMFELTEEERAGQTQLGL